MKIRKIENINSGFTLLEITVVIFIIVMGMLGVLSLVRQSVKIEYVNKNMIIASQLSQEGLELVRNRRDDNWLREENWEFSSTTGSGFDIIQDQSYVIDYTGLVNDTPNDVSDPLAQLYLDSNGFYNNSGAGTPTIFSRLITVGNESTSSTTVNCLVQWKKGTNIYNFTAQTVLYNWREID